MTAGWRFAGGPVDADGIALGETAGFSVADAALLRVYLGLSIGRHPALNAFTLPDATISRRHARLTRTAEGLAIEDLHSLNGVFIDGARLPIFRPMPVAEGATLQLGRVRLAVSRIAA